MLAATALSPAAHAQQFGGFGGTGGFGGPGPGPGPGPEPGPGGGASDPGLRSGTPGAGGPLPGLSPGQAAFFTAAQARFNTVDAVPAPGGLGPTFNLDSCGGCHAFPAEGGSSPPTNPQVTVGKALGATNTIPPFITANGPVREVRFIKNPDGTPDGGVHDLFTIAGRSDAPNCHLAQPDFAAAIAARNLIFRIPTPTYGLGLVENIPDTGLQAAVSGIAQQRASLGISGHFNTSGNDGTITRFGWKAQNKSLLIFAGEAYNVEQGVTNEAFPNERNTTPGCAFNGTPEDTTNFSLPTNPSGSQASDFSSDVTNFAMFMRLLAPPTPATSTTASTGGTPAVQVASNSVLPAVSGSGAASPSGSSSLAVSRGQQVFSNIGCAACHITNQTTAASSFDPTFSNVSFSPLSDFAVHTMGTGLADNVSQGNANGQQFRSAPLWGVGQRIFFLHDGRTKDLNEAIQDHASSGSEANQVIAHYNMLSVTDRQSLLDYLRSL
jgi:CxxC motif-containing protein (DUF1111 family)